MQAERVRIHTQAFQITARYTRMADFSLHHSCAHVWISIYCATLLAVYIPSFSSFYPFDALATEERVTKSF